MPRPGAGARWRALLAGVLILALLAASPSAAEEASPAPVLSWQTGAGRSHLIPALEVGGFVNVLGHTRFGAVEWRPDEGVCRTVGE
jgi:hypothetical protein